MAIRSLITNQIYPWQVKKLIGSGTYSNVYLYKTPSSVAIKISNGTHGDPDPFFLKEIGILMLLGKQLLDVVLINGKIGIVFHVAKTNLSQYIKHNFSYFSLLDKKILMYQLAKNVEYIQSKGILHGDLKPENILINAKGNPYIADFGISSFSREEEQIIGSAWWNSPEVLLGGKYSNASHIWALGTIFYQLLHYNPPFTGGEGNPQILLYFNEFGVPNEENWPGVTSLPNYPKILGKSLPKTFNRSNKLINRMFTLNPTNRIKIEDILLDPWFNEIKEQNVLSNIQNEIALPTSNHYSYVLLIIWLELACKDLGIPDHILAQAIHIFVMSRKKLVHNNGTIQLYGLSSLYLASCLFANSNMIPPSTLLEISGNIFNHAQFTTGVYQMVSALDFNFCQFTSYYFLELHLKKVDNVKAIAHTLLVVSYISEVSTLYKPESIALLCIETASKIGDTEMFIRRIKQGIGYLKDKNDLKIMSRMGVDVEELMGSL